MRNSVLYDSRKFKSHGCRVCKHNPMGICELCGKEVPIGKVLGNGRASWCPKGKTDERKKHV